MSTIKTETVCNAMNWLFSGKTGLSSEFMMGVLLSDSALAKSGPYPHDGSDLGRCLGLLESVPEFREKLDLMRRCGERWNLLITHWAELEALYVEDQQNNSRKLYPRMRELYHYFDEPHIEVAVAYFMAHSVEHIDEICRRYFSNTMPDTISSGIQLLHDGRRLSMYQLYEVMRTHEAMQAGEALNSKQREIAVLIDAVKAQQATA